MLFSRVDFRFAQEPVHEVARYLFVEFSLPGGIPGFHGVDVLYGRIRIRELADESMIDPKLVFPWTDHLNQKRMSFGFEVPHVFIPIRGGRELVVELAFAPFVAVFTWRQLGFLAGSFMYRTQCQILYAFFQMAWKA